MRKITVFTGQTRGDINKPERRPIKTDIKKRTALTIVLSTPVNNSLPPVQYSQKWSAINQPKCGDWGIKYFLLNLSYNSQNIVIFHKAGKCL